MNIIKSILIKMFPVVSYAIIAVVLGFFVSTNPTQSLSGWDTLHPEFDFSLNFSQLISGVWNEGRGLGLMNGMAPIADLSRVIILWISAIFVPVNMIRTWWIVICWFLGMSGVYGLVRDHAKNNNRIGAWIAGLFYLFNVGTLLTFYLPFEPFSSFFGFLPWFMWGVLNTLRFDNKKSYIGLALIYLVGASAFFVQTFFVVWMMLLMTLCIGTLIVIGKLKLIPIIKTIGITLIANFYWLIPVMFFMITQGAIVGASKGNLLSTGQMSLINKGYGTYENILQMKGYLLAYTGWLGGDKFGIVAEFWQMYLNRSYIMIIGYLMFILGGLGLVISLIKDNKSKWGFAFLVLSYFMLAGENKPFGFIYSILIDYIPFFGQVFRVVYTKWLPVLILVNSLGIGMFINYVVTYKKSNKITSFAKYLLTIIVVTLMLVRVWPVFDRKMISEKVKIKFPNEYFVLFEKMRDLPNGRIVKLPAISLWGWDLHNWGYEGSGFIWYGIKQPILDRAFDVWSPYNETFYNQFSTALYGGDKADVTRVIEQYDVKYALLDESVVAPGQDKQILRFDEIKKIASELGWQETFHEGFLTVWDTGVDVGEKFVSVPAQYTQVEGETLKTRKDVIYDEVGTYVSDNLNYYPFADLLKEEIKYVEYGESQVTISAANQNNAGTLTIPGLVSGQKTVANYIAKLSGDTVTIDWEPIYTINENEGPNLPRSEIELPAIQEFVWLKIGQEEAVFVEKNKEVRASALLTAGTPIEIALYEGQTKRVDDLKELWTADKVQKCWEEVKDEGVVGSEAMSDSIKFVIIKAAGCLSIPLSKSNQDELLQIVVHHKSSSGIKPQFCLDEEEPPYECVNKDVWSRTPSSREFEYEVRTIAATRGEKYWLDLSAKPDGLAGEEGVIEYQKPLVARYDKLNEVAISADYWQTMIEPYKFVINDQDITARVATTPMIYDLAKLGINKVKNCDVLDRGVAEKIGQSYMADEYGAVCDYAQLSDIRTDMPYLMRMQGENKQGRSIKYFLYNEASKRNDLEYLLSAGLFDQSFSILPWQFDGGYILNTETRSFGEKTENSLDPIELYYFPLEQLSQARVGDLEQKDNLVKIGQVNKTGTWLYKVEAEGEGLLKLSQGYDDGWVAFQGKGKLEHVKINGWANGWHTRGDGQITIFYWPQLLEYLGFALLGTTILVIWKSKK